MKLFVQHSITIIKQLLFFLVNITALKIAVNISKSRAPISKYMLARSTVRLFLHWTDTCHRNTPALLHKHTDFKQWNKIHSHFLSIMSKFQNRVLSQNSTFEKQLKIVIKLTKAFIKNNKNLLITKADKGNTTVIIEKSYYLAKITKLFNDEKYCEKIKRIR